MIQVPRNLTMGDVGLLADRRYLIHGRDGQYCPAFDDTITDGRVTLARLPPPSPNSNAHAERPVNDECLATLIPFGEPALRTALRASVERFHGERNHQGKNHLLLIPQEERRHTGPVRCREPLGGLLTFYHRAVA